MGGRRRRLSLSLRRAPRLTSEELIAYCREEGLAGFKIPRLIEFRETLPKGGTGKVLKSELKRALWEKR